MSLATYDLGALAALDEIVEEPDLSPAAIRKIIANLEHEFAQWNPLPHQVPPEGDWYGWLLFGGRGAGKTDGAAQAMHDHMTGPPCDRRVPGGHRGAIVAPTLGDGAESCVLGPSGLRARDPRITMRSETGGTIVRWPNGAEAKLFGAHTTNDTDRMRAGGNRCIVWMEELAAWRKLADGFSQAQFGLRLGRKPRIISSTTPKNRPTIRDIVRMSKDMAAAIARGDDVPLDERWVVTSAPTMSNPYLPKHIKRMLYRKYAKTRLGRQELLGLLLSDLGTRITAANFSHIDQPPHGPGWKRVRYWDLASTEEGAANDPDYTAGARVAYNAKRNLLVIEHMVHCRRSPAGVEEKILETARADGPTVPVWIEQDPGQAGVDQLRNYKRVLGGLCKVEGNRPTGAKEVRAQPFEILVEQQRAALVDGPWVQAFTDECESWGTQPEKEGDEASQGGKEDGIHDDQIDAVSGAVKVLTNPPKRAPKRLGADSA